MDLFNRDSEINLLPFDGIVIYRGLIMEPEQAEEFRRSLFHTVEWKNDEVVMFGKHLRTARKVAWYGDTAYAYAYSGKVKVALPWTEELRTLKAQAEKTSGAVYNSCLLNLYHDGTEGMSWHSDDERSLCHNSTIASLSFGAVKKFSFKHKKSKEMRSVVLESGSLLEMKGSTQTYWWHSLPKSKQIKDFRINLTFRTMATEKNRQEAALSKFSPR